MNKIIHMRIDVSGAIRNRSFSGFTDKFGDELSRVEVRDRLRALQYKGVKFIPLGDCKNWDAVKGECMGCEE